MKKLIKSFIILLTAALLFGCANTSTPPPELFDFDFKSPASYIGTYDSMDTAIVEKVDTEAKTITLINYALNRSYTLLYNELSIFLDKFGQALSIAQISTGEIVDVCFLKNSKTLVSLQKSKAAFSFDNISRYTLDDGQRIALIGEESYRLNDSTLITSGGNRIDTADIIARDIITIRGVDRDIWSIVIERGHGYLKLVNDFHALGGWIEIDNHIIQRITDNMLLTVPEGTFDINILARGFNTTRRVTIERNKETAIDIGDVTVETPLKGRVIFNVSPANATVYIDGDEVDVRGVVELEFGLYQVVCEAPGYDPVMIHIRVSQEIASVSVTMDAAGANNAGANTDNNSSSNIFDVPNGSLPIEIGSNRVYIEEPQDVEVYQDGVYMGISPVHFEKVPGSRTITLRRQGYVTKSYQIHLDNDLNDVTYSFSTLEQNTLDTGEFVSEDN
ncbi:MAG: PEGA domain-containing protein [Lachnospiraceae bacterium]|nr:PEGA domain-containing protein [Lachnospiraceae bacterium]